jgi:hypothetical protein
MKQKERSTEEAIDLFVFDVGYVGGNDEYVGGSTGESNSANAEGSDGHSR